MASEYSVGEFKTICSNFHAVVLGLVGIKVHGDAKN